MTAESTPTTLTHAALHRAFQRALDEGLVAHPQPDGRWACKQYQISLTGSRPQDLICDCADAVFRERLCKHAICVVFYRVYGLVPCPPLAPGATSRLPACVDDFLARLEQGTAAAA